MTRAAGPRLTELADALEAGATSSYELVEACLTRIDDKDGEGARAFIEVDRDGALRAACAMDRLRSVNAAPSRFAGIPISIKDLFDIRGQVTRAGSTVLADAAPAKADAPAIERLRRMGFVLIGRTNMTEFAYSGLGLNPHYGTPANGWDRATRRIPGGSSSGAAISVLDGMAHGALGTDTGGSCRIPAAFTGLVGFKPTASRVPLDGAVPLSKSLDSIGPIARSAECCAVMDAILAGESVRPLERRTPRGLRFLVPTNIVFDDIEDVVSRAFENVLTHLSDAGATIDHAAMPELDDIAAINAKGGFTAPESFALHRSLLARNRDDYDPRVSVRIARGEQVSAADYIDATALRAALIEKARARLSGYDAMIMPTVPIVAPRIVDLDDDAVFTRINLLALRNSTLVNMLDGCATSLPIHRPGDAPVGLMIAGPANTDRRILEIAHGLEQLLAGRFSQ